MKRLLYFSLFLLFLSNCKDNKADESEILSQITRKWRLIEIEETIQDEKKWQPVAVEDQVEVSFSFDGKTLNMDSEPGCCPPSALIINGTLFNIKFTAISTHPCPAILCGEVPPLNVEVNENVMTISGGQRVKYVRN
jgi:Zn-dependent M16 (insulinase) family peptidase